MAVVGTILAGCGREPVKPLDPKVFKWDPAVWDTSADRIFSGEKAIALARAAENGDVATIDALVREGVDVNTRGARNYTPLLWSFYKRSWDGYMALLRNKADPNILTDRGEAVTLVAAEYGDPKWLREALAHGGNPNLVDIGNPFGHMETPLIYAPGNDPHTLRDREENVRLLLAAGANPNYQGIDGQSAFFYAVTVTDYEAAAAMLDAGADMRLKSAAGDDAVEWLHQRLGEPGMYALEGPNKKWLFTLVDRMNAKGAKLEVLPSESPKPKPTPSPSSPHE